MRKLTKTMQDSIMTRLYEWDYQMHGFEYGEEHSFMVWFLDNAYSFEASLISNTDILEDSKVISNRCFGNSQYLANRYNIEYAEGFILYQDSYIPHGFNIHSNRVNDYTLTKVLGGNNLSKEYYGIIIPIDFIVKKQGEDIELPSINSPLIIEYYREQQNAIKKDNLIEGSSIVKYANIPVTVTTLYKEDCLVKDNKGELHTVFYKQLFPIEVSTL